jgi:hypothetical protein
VERAGQRRRVDATGDPGNLGRGERHHPRLRAVAEHGVEVVEVAPSGAHDHDRSHPARLTQGQRSGTTPGSGDQAGDLALHRDHAVDLLQEVDQRLQVVPPAGVALEPHDATLDPDRDLDVPGHVGLAEDLLGDLPLDLLVRAEEHAQQVAAAHDADQPVVVVDHGQVLDVEVVQQPHRLGHGLVRAHGQHRGGHQLPGGGCGRLDLLDVGADPGRRAALAHRRVLLEDQVGRGDDAHEPAVRVEDRQRAHPVPVHQGDDLAVGGVHPDGDDLPGHQLLHHVAHLPPPSGRPRSLALLTRTLCRDGAAPQGHPAPLREVPSPGQPVLTPWRSSWRSNSGRYASSSWAECSRRIACSP